ncbi:MAG: hypothetical protein QM718_15420 [Steroidobacteraceae bacterium]
MAAAADSDIKVWIDAGKGDVAKETRNKQVVVGGWLQDPGKEHWQNFMVPEFINHDPDEPRVGAQALVDWLVNDRFDPQAQIGRCRRGRTWLSACKAK